MVHLPVRCLSYSRRLCVGAILAERGDDRREGVASAFQHFGGVPPTFVSDNARPLVLRRGEPHGDALGFRSVLSRLGDASGGARAYCAFRDIVITRICSS